MAILMRNPSFIRQVVALLAIAGITTVSSYILTDAALSDASHYSAGCLSPQALSSLCVLVTGVVFIASFFLISYRRYAEISRLSFELDGLLHGNRSIRLSDYREGDVAVLRNEIGKLCSRLARTADDLTKEKAFLAQSLADISHQIRTPLTAAELMIPLVARISDERERTAKLRELEILLDRISWLVTSLLKMARFDAGSVKIASTTTRIADSVAEAVKPLEIAMDMHEIDCVIDVDNSASFKGDSAWTAEALSNILKNCIEHTPDGGDISIHAYEDATACRVVIEDGGDGISPEDLPHIFERFYRGSTQGSASTQEAFTSAMQPIGFGIGLALAKTLINAQGGTLRASNTSRGGARFEIAFPKVTI